MLGLATPEIERWIAGKGEENGNGLNTNGAVEFPVDSGDEDDDVEDLNEPRRSQIGGLLRPESGTREGLRPRPLSVQIPPRKATWAHLPAPAQHRGGLSRHERPDEPAAHAHLGCDVGLSPGDTRGDGRAAPRPGAHGPGVVPGDAGCDARVRGRFEGTVGGESEIARGERTAAKMAAS